MPSILCRAAICTLAMFAISACSKEKAASFEAPPPAVIVATVKKESVKPFVEFVGRTQATEDVIIKARVKGNLLSRLFAEGNNIKAGDLLFEIDPAPYQSVVNQRKAAMAQAQATYDIAVIKWQRSSKLHKAGTISEMDFDVVVSNKISAEAAVEAAKASLEAAELDLSYTRIVAPIDGRVSRSLVSVGALISPDSTELATLVQLDPIWVNFQASEKQMVETQRGVEQNTMQQISPDDLIMRVRLADGEYYGETGTIDFVDNRIDQSTGTLSVRAVFPNPNSMLLPGQYVTVNMTSPQDSQALLVPQSSVQEDQQGKFLLVVNDQQEVEKRVVTMGLRFGINWSVKKGLEEGDKVIVEGLQKVRPGIKVNIQEQTTKAFDTPKA
ncbi:efflux RND transporter periplasmic adaptor subunit [Motilimonas pumila]|uniref:Efflux RND transporter periplasmic adaptor subunit n=1 Tax=Motilimonas pumila TaxID=2303987 RepID=A0A418YGX4_9GAMM|nr:efflux RND transporter periplasmic adaptor subunit [Motilimonas pumila]RJG49111.1 efflux RND transporter periplasmic adaptor subunit [Motilimonas pumila]